MSKIRLMQVVPPRELRCMLSTGEEWNPSNLYKIDMPVALVEKQKAKAIRQAKKLLQESVKILVSMESKSF